MKKSIIAIVMCVMLLALSACAVQLTQENKDNTETKTESTEDTTIMLSLGNAPAIMPQDANELQTAFNLELLKQLGKEDGNVFYSSLSINQAMSMVYFGAQNTTQQEIADVLGYDNMTLEEVASYQKALLESFKDTGDTIFDNANSIWIDDELEVYKNYMDTMNDAFETEAYNVDLQQVGIADIVNGWIDEKTEGMIEKLYESDAEINASVMVLLNAIYFKGSWTEAFKKDYTYQTDFMGQSATSKVDMMLSNESVKGIEGDNYKSVFLPYGDDERYSMVVILPNDDINEFIDNLTDEKLAVILSTYEQKEDAIVEIPKFELEQKTEMKEILSAMGINEVFKESSDLSLISSTPLMIDEVLHKARIVVDEEGTEAAAATGVTMLGSAMPGEIFEFIANKPFLFFIVDSENDLVLFTGQVNDLG